MVLFSSWFSKKEPEDYEQILSSLAVDIQKRQTRLSEIRLRERRTTLVFTVYTFALWAVYVGLWYAGWLPNFGRQSSWSPTAKGVPIVLGPIVIQFTRRIVQTWYTRKGNAEEKTLKSLYAKQRTKVEDIKKKTNYYSTRNLIERYDETPSSSPLRQRPVAQQQRQQPGTPPPRPTPVNGQTPAASQSQSPAVKRRPDVLSPTPPTPLPAPRKQWYDKVADALLGEDEFSAGSTASRYALICQKCFTHNGLVKESMWEDAQYVCPKCGHFNPSVRAQRAQARSPTSPASPHGSHVVSTPSPPQYKSGPPIQGQVQLPKPAFVPQDGEHVGEMKTARGRRTPSPSPLSRPADADIDEDEAVDGRREDEGHVGDRSVGMDVDS